MLKSKFFAAAIGLAAMAFAGNAGAVVINFTGISGACNYSEAGYNFNCTGTHTDANGELRWHDVPSDNDIIMTRVDGMAFDILSLDALAGAAFSIITTAGTFNSAGGLALGVTVNLLGVLSATFDTPGTLIARLDNINTVKSVIPEPGTLAILGLGLAGLGVARRRKIA